MDTGIIFWICVICVVCIIASVIFCKPYLGVVFVIVSIPFEAIINLGSTSFYPLEVILTVFVLICIYKNIVGRYNYFGNTKLVYCCIPFVLCIILSAIKSIELPLTMKEIVRWLELIVIYYLTINLINDDKKIRIILYSMFLTMVIVSTCGIINYYNGVGCMFWGQRASSFFGNPNPFAGYVNLIIPVLFGMMMASVFLWEQIILGFFTVLTIMAWFFSFSRSGWLSLILTITLVLSLTKAKKRVLLYLVIFFAILAIIFSFSNNRQKFMSIVRLQPVLTSLEFRTVCYPIGFDIVKDDLIIGVGVGNYHILAEKLVKEFDFEMGRLRQIVETNLHSLYLQIFVETGIMGLSAFVFWLVCIVKFLVGSMKTLENTRNYSLFVGLVGGVIIYLFNNLTDILVVHGIHLQWGIILGLAVVLTQLREPETCPETG
jgi:putative inorganic carbon (hco3(-)) transporter